MSAESLTGLCEEADALALALACENRNVESDTVHRLAAKAKDLDVECDQWESDWTKVSEERAGLLEKVAAHPWTAKARHESAELTSATDGAKVTR